jgi:thiol:disulfide interchange protein DsbA
MKRREFSAAAAGVIGAAALGLPGVSLAQRAFVEGKDFRALGKQLPVEAPAGKVEVIEFFWYSCPHCNAFEPKLVNWIKSAPADVVVRRVPAAFRDTMVPEQRLFYTLETLGKLDLHGKVFEAVHVNHERLDRQDAIVAFAEKNGIDKAKFIEVYNSFSVNNKARKATQLQDAFAVEGVPALGIAGRYYTDGTMAGNMDRCLQVTNYLIGEARKVK